MRFASRWNDVKRVAPLTRDEHLDIIHKAMVDHERGCHHPKVGKPECEWLYDKLVTEGVLDGPR